MIQHFNIICEDLLRAEPTDAEISPPSYVEGITDLRRVEYYYQLIKRAQRRKDRMKALMYTFYLGELIEIDNNIQRIAKRKLSSHYYTAAVRTFYIFETCPDQIARTQRMSIANVRRLTSVEYQLVLPDF